MEPKKISFGFMKTKKAEKPVVDETRDYIECVEEKAIKVIGGETIEEQKPLVIPMKPNTLITAERLREIAEKVEKEIAEEPQPQIKTEPSEEKPCENETLDQMAVRELLQDAKKEVKVESSELTVPIPAKVVIDGQKESTLEDYESIPIQDFGMAMLRGMGWTPNKDGSKYKQPELRPKGLGLGADKVIKEKQKKKTSSSSQDKEEELSIVKNAFVKITTGKYSGYYGKVVSLDEDNGRVMVDIPIKKETVNLSEFMMEPVTRAEFDKQSRVINQESYEEYKNKEKSQSSSRRDSPNEPSSSHKYDLKADKRNKTEERHRDSRRKNREEIESNGRNRDKNRKNRDSSSEEKVRKSRRDSSSEEKSSRRKKEKKKYSSNESIDSLSDEKKKKHKSRKKQESSDDELHDNKKNRRRSKTPEGNRDIDKKRKGKKKKRDRDRSPNYKKHRK